MSGLSKGTRVVYTGKGVFSSSPELAGQEGVIVGTGLNTVDVRWDNTDRATAPPFGVFSDNVEPVTKATDLVNHPPHYTRHPSGVECITITQHMNFCRGNAIKYLWRAGEKGNELQDLEKAAFYVAKEIERVKSHGL